MIDAAMSGFLFSPPSPRRFLLPDDRDNTLLLQEG